MVASASLTPGSDRPAPASPSAALRVDVAAGFSRDASDLDAWLRAASLLHLANRARGSTRKELLYEAIASATDLLGDDRIEEVVSWEWPGMASPVEALMVLIMEIYRVGALNLAAVMTDDLLHAATMLTPINRGQLLALRARLEWMLGRHEDAVDRYKYIAALGKRHRLSELVARAENGLGAIAQLRGNFPAVAVHSHAAAEIADHLRLPSVARVAHYGRMVAAARLGQHDQALLEGWKVLQLSRGRPAHEAEILQNFGQLLFEMGHVDAGRACFAAVIDRRPHIRVVLPALGGLALASAQRGQEGTVEWAVREVWAARKLEGLHHEVASALIESASALLLLGRRREAERFRAAGMDVASRYGLHELEFRAESLQAPTEAEPVRLRAPAARVVRKLEDMEPKRLPKRAVLVGTSA